MVLHKQYFIIFLLAAVSAGTISGAQTLSSDNNKERDELFLFEVKTVDEFMERFNDEANSFMRKQFQKQDKQYAVSRAELLVSLFNLDNDWVKDSTDFKDFVSQATTKKNPQYLHFNDSGWYAEAKCAFLYNGKLIEIPLILDVKTENKGAKWMICGVGGGEVLPDTIQTPWADLPVPAHNKFKYIPTTSHATNFVELTNVFCDTMDAYSYFEPEALKTASCRRLVQLILKNKIKFQYVSKLSFHFFQMPQWVFEVQQFNRGKLNSGWLIENIKKVTTAEKELEKKKMLRF